MHLERLSLWQYRNYAKAEVLPAENGVTVFEGPNGAGKTNLLEAIGYIATLRSFRGAPPASIVRAGASMALVGAQVFHGGRRLQLEAELLLSGRGRLRRNGQVVRRGEDFVGNLLVTTFSPDDIGIVKGAPERRRELLDTVVVSLSPSYEGALGLLERAVRQRNALLRAAGGNLTSSAAKLLDVWDAKLAEAGETVVEARESLVRALRPPVEDAYGALGGDEPVGLSYERSWEGGLLEALRGCRNEDIRRCATGVGPQRDELRISLAGRSARLQASQGQQRGLALALRLGAHSLLARHHETSPVLLLDDVFSELDPARSTALASCLPDGQALLTAAGPLPPVLPVAAAVGVRAGTLAVAERPAPGQGD